MLEFRKAEALEEDRFKQSYEKLNPKLKINSMYDQEECEAVINRSQIEIDTVASEIEKMQLEFERLDNDLKYVDAF